MNIKIFENEEFGSIRTVTINNEPYFVGKDVASILGYSNARDAIANHVYEDDKGVEKLDTPGGKQNMTVINESGLYALIFGSRLESAKRFKHWVTSEVLPSIRKHGAYMTYTTLEQALTNPDFLIQLATKLKEEREARKQLERTVKENEAKAVLSDAITASNTTILMRDLAKILRKNNIKTGEKRLYQWMRENGYILKNSTRPTQYAMELGLFELCERVVSRNEFGQPIVALTTYVTGKGQKYFINKFLGGSEDE